MKSYSTLKNEKEQKITELFNKCKVFFAFSDEQFTKNKTELKEGEKYISIGGGGYIPADSLNQFIEEEKEINKWFKNEVKSNKQKEAQILYELQNHECFYTGDIEDAFEVLKSSYTVEEVQTVFNNNRKYAN